MGRFGITFEELEVEFKRILMELAMLPKESRIEEATDIATFYLIEVVKRWKTHGMTVEKIRNSAEEALVRKMRKDSTKELERLLGGDTDVETKDVQIADIEGTREHSKSDIRTDTHSERDIGVGPTEELRPPDADAEVQPSGGPEGAEGSNQPVSKRVGDIPDLREGSDRSTTRTENERSTLDTKGRGLVDKKTSGDVDESRSARQRVETPGEAGPQRVDDGPQPVDDGGTGAGEEQMSVGLCGNCGATMPPALSVPLGSKGISTRPVVCPVCSWRPAEKIPRRRVDIKPPKAGKSFRKKR